MSYLYESPLRIQLWWNQQDGIQEYLLYRRLQNRDVVLLERFPGTSGQYIDDQIARGEVYIYLLVAVDSAGNRSRAAEQVVTTPSASSNQAPNVNQEEEDADINFGFEDIEDEAIYYEDEYRYDSEPIFNYD
jgi:hypothetical protein